MHLGYAIAHQRQVPIIVEQPGLDAGNVLGQPFAVAERHEHVLPAMQQQDCRRSQREWVLLGPIDVTAVADVDDSDYVVLVIDPVDDAVGSASCAEPVI